MRPLKFTALLLAFIWSIGVVSALRAQVNVSTEGTDFWMSFTPNITPPNSLDLFVTSGVTTSGTVSSLQGFSQSFNIVANQVTTINIPQTPFHPTAYGTIDSLALHITANDPISVYAWNQQNATADASRILPTSALGDEYYVLGHHNIGNLYSLFMVVATADGTVVEITPTVETSTGNQPGTTFSVGLDQGGTYLVRNQDIGNQFRDLTGSFVRSTDPNKPIAIFAGANCINISGCGACDMIYDQNIPAARWGKEYYVSPPDSVTRYAYRVLVRDSNTTVTIDGTSTLLHRGDSLHFEGATGTHCVSGDKPIAVVQYLEGINCAGAGDPAMMMLNPADEEVTRATFTTVNTSIINDHYVNIVMETSKMGQITLDGVLIDTALFDTFALCNDYSYAQVYLPTQGSHTLEGNGTSFIAYIYGLGGFESYAYSVGSGIVLDVPVTKVKTCSDDSVVFQTDSAISNIEWTLFNTPNILGTGPNLTLHPPLKSGIYVARGDPPGPSTDTTVYFDLDAPDTPFGISPIAQQDTLCPGELAELDARLSDLLVYADCDQNPGQPAWVNNSTSLIADSCGNPINFALYFNHAGTRLLESNDYDFTGGGIIRFSLLIAESSNSCADASPGEDVVLEFSTDGGSTWTIAETFFEDQYPEFTEIDFVVPLAAQTAATRWRWRQLSHSGAGLDLWALDEIKLFRYTTQVNAYSIQWSPGAPLNDSTIVAPSATASFGSSFEFSIVVTDTNGCSVIDSLAKTLSFLELPAIDLGPDTMMCEGDSLDFTVTDTLALEFVWQDSSTNPGFPVFAPGVYHVQVTNFCGSSSDTMVVDSLIPALIRLGIDTFLCPGDSIPLDATVAFGTYLWQDGTTTPNITAVDSGLYWCEATNLCGSDRDTIDILLLPPPPLDLGPDTALCWGDSLLLNAYDTMATYLWIDSSTAPNFTIDSIGQFYLTATNVCGVSSDSINVDFYGPPTVDLGADSLLCPGGITSFQVTQPYAQYLWSTGSTQDQLIISTGDTFWVQITNACGMDSDTVVFTSFPYPFVDLGSDTGLCFSDSLPLQISFPNATYLWSNNSIGSNFTIYGPGQYWAAVTNICGTYTDSITVALVDSVLFDLGNDTVICQGETLQLTTGLNNSYTHFWNGGQTVNTFTVDKPGSYWVNVNNICGSGTDTLTVQYEQPPQVELGPTQLLCLGDSTALQAQFSRSSYAWSTGVTTSEIMAKQEGMYTVTVTNLCGTTLDSVQLLFEDTLRISLGEDRLSCVGTEERIQALWSIETNMLWSTGATTKEIAVNQTGDYWVQAQNICGTVSDTILLTFNPLPTVSVQGISEVCKGDSVMLSAQSNWSNLEWNDGSTVDSLLAIEPGPYTVSVENNCGVVSDTLLLIHRPDPFFSLGPDRLICPETPASLKIPAFAQIWEWEDGSRATGRFITDPGTYSLWIADDLGCVAEDSVTFDLCTVIWVPNAFTPSGDGLNDVFKPQGENLNEYRFRVYNRWGQKLFETARYEEGWNGVFRGEEAQSGTYIWEVYYVDKNQQEQVEVGNFTLIRR